MCSLREAMGKKYPGGGAFNQHPFTEYPRVPGLDVAVGQSQTADVMPRRFVYESPYA